MNLRHAMEKYAQSVMYDEKLHVAGEWYCQDSFELVIGQKSLTYSDVNYTNCLLIRVECV